MYNEQAMISQTIGEFRDIIKYDDGTITETPWSKNTIVDNVCKLIACLFKSQAGYSGIGYWAIGKGLDTWDDENPPAPVKSDTKLVSEIGRKAIPTSAIKFVDINGIVTTDVTNRLLIELTFDKADCIGKWREFSIVGGNATAVADSGIFINHKTHGLITKTDKMTVTRQIRFTFSL